MKDMGSEMCVKITLLLCLLHKGSHQLQSTVFFPFGDTSNFSYCTDFHKSFSAGISFAFGMTLKCTSHFLETDAHDHIFENMKTGFSIDGSTFLIAFPVVFISL